MSSSVKSASPGTESMSVSGLVFTSAKLKNTPEPSVTPLISNLTESPPAKLGTVQLPTPVEVIYDQDPLVWVTEIDPKPPIGTISSTTILVAVVFP